MIPGIRYRGGKRGLHRIRPVTGLLWLATVLVVALGLGSLTLKAGMLVLVFGLAVWSEGSVRPWFKSIRFVLIFSLFLFVVQVLAVREGEILACVGMCVTRDGLISGANMALRFVVILSASFAFALTTDPDALARSFIRWGVPYRYGFALILALRFVPFFRSELRVVRDAQRLRGIEVSVRSISGIRRAIRYTFLPVLMSGLLRVDTIAMSMKGRAFGLHPTRTLDPHGAPSSVDVVMWLLILASALAAVLARRAQWL